MKGKGNLKGKSTVHGRQSTARVQGEGHGPQDAVPPWSDRFQRSVFGRRSAFAWKASARSETLLTKFFAGRASSELWFDWDSLPQGMGLEARLSRLAGWR